MYDVLPGLRLEGHDVSITNILLVNRQFAAEYRAVANRKGSMTLKVRKHACELTDRVNTAFKLPRPALALTTLRVIMYCCSGVEVGLHNGWMIHLMDQLPKARKLFIHMGHSPKIASEVLAALWRFPPALLPGIQSYRVYENDHGKVIPLLEWSTTTQKFVEVVADEEEQEKKDLETLLRTRRRWRRRISGV